MTCDLPFVRADLYSLITSGPQLPSGGAVVSGPALNRRDRPTEGITMLMIMFHVCIVLNGQQWRIDGVKGKEQLNGLVKG